MAKDHKATMNCLTNNLKTLTDTMASAFSLLQQSMQRPGPSPYSPYSGLGQASGSGYNYHYFPYSQSPAHLIQSQGFWYMHIHTCSIGSALSS